MIKNSVVLLLISLCFWGQTHAQNVAYELMLKGLYSNTVPRIQSQTLAKASPSQYVILDTREAAEYNVSHLPQARYVGYNYFKLKDVADIPKNQPIVVYCSVGYRSEKIGEKLLAAGYQNVQNLHGGIFEWVNQGNPIVKKEKTPTQEVHGYDKTWGIWVKKGKVVYGG